MRSHPIKLTTELSTVLNLLRTVAASGVFITHLLQIYTYRLYQQIIPTPNEMPFYSIAAGFYFVSLFFIISGFLITISLINNYVNNGAIDSRQFINRRLKRLWPNVIFALILCAFITYIIHFFQLIGSHSFLLPNEFVSGVYELDTHPFNYLATLFFVQRIFGFAPPSIDTPLWTLGYEFWIYIIALCFALLITAKKNQWAHNMIACFIIAAIISFAIIPMHALILCLSWLIGAILAYIYAKQWYRVKEVRLFAQIIGVSCALLGILLLSVNGLNIINIYHIRENPAQFIFPFLITLMLASCLIFTQFFKSFSSLANFSTLASTAKYSYTLYVIHFPINVLAFSLLGKHLPLFTNYQLGLTIGLMFIITHCIAFGCSKFTEPQSQVKNITSRTEERWLTGKR